MHARLPHLALVVLLTGLLPGLSALLAAESDAAREAEVRRKTQEIERLKEELDRAQADLKKLEAENQRLRTGKSDAAPATPRPSAESRKPAPVVATLPPLDAGQAIEVSELVGQFAAEPEAARERYAKKLFRVKGTVAGFDTGLVTRGYYVRLESPERAITVLCHFRVPDEYTAVYMKRSGQTLVARVGKGSELQLFQVGEGVVIEGTCKGLKKGELTFSRCEVLR